jgi:hypothetical protein
LQKLKTAFPAELREECTTYLKTFKHREQSVFKYFPIEFCKERERERERERKKGGKGETEYNDKFLH